MWVPDCHTQQGILVIEEFWIGEALHLKYGMLVTVLDSFSPKYVLLPSQVCR
jgi:hypothetical protein